MKTKAVLVFLLAKAGLFAGSLQSRQDERGLTIWFSAMADGVFIPFWLAVLAGILFIGAGIWITVLKLGNPISPGQPWVPGGVQERYPDKVLHLFQEIARDRYLSKNRLQWMPTDNFPVVGDIYSGPAYGLVRVFFKDSLKLKLLFGLHAYLAVAKTPSGDEEIYLLKGNGTPFKPVCLRFFRFKGAPTEIIKSKSEKQPAPDSSDNEDGCTNNYVVLNSIKARRPYPRRA